MLSPARHVVGVDFGTLSGRAVVVRVARRRGARHGGARVRHGGHRPAPARHGRAAAAGLGAAGPGGLASTCCATRCPRALAGAGCRPGAASSASAPTSPPARAADARRRHAAVRARPSSRDRPHAYVKLWKHHAAQPHADRINALAARAGRAVAGPLRRADLLRVGVRQGACSCWRRTPRSTPRSSAGSRRPTGSSGSCAARYVRNACTAGYKGIHQDGRYPSRDYLAALEPGVRRLRHRQARAADRPARATAPAG